jgi:hypothetical protein
MEDDHVSDDKIVKLGYDVDKIKESVSSIDSKIDKIEEQIIESNLNFVKHVASEAVSDEVIVNELRKMNELQKEGNENWREHMQRTRLNEVAVHQLKEIYERSEKRLQIVEDDLNGRKAIVKFFKVIGIIAAAVSGVIGAYIAVTSILNL